MNQEEILITPIILEVKENKYVYCRGSYAKLSRWQGTDLQSDMFCEWVPFCLLSMTTGACSQHIVYN